MYRQPFWYVLTWQSWRYVRHFKHLMLVGWALSNWGYPVSAQVVPDSTLGAQASIVTAGGTTDTITGGVRAGGNLFHSFQQFNVALGRSAYFSDPGVSNIFARITGSQPSSIQGTLGVTGAANLFLLNPNGVLFGPNARLDVQGSFVATTANALQFANSGTFSASVPTDPSLLTVAPSAFLFNQIQSTSQIQNQGILQVPTGQSLVLLGGPLNLIGGQVVAPAGRIELGGLRQPDMVGLELQGSRFSLSYPVGRDRVDIQLSQAAQVNASGVGGGAIQIQGGNVSLLGTAQIQAETLGDQPGAGITLNANMLLMQEGSTISTTTRGSGTGGNLVVNVPSILVRGVSATNTPSGLFAEVQSTGSGGNLLVHTDQLLVEGGGTLSTSTRGAGQGGNLTVNANQSVTVQGESPNGGRPGSVLAARAFSTGNAGILTVNTGQLLLQNGGQLSTSPFDAGRGGDLFVNARDSVVIRAPGRPNRTGLYSQVSAAGAGGNITVNTRSLLIQDGSWISTLTNSTGRGGDITIQAADFVQLVGTDGRGPGGGEASLILTDTTGPGRAGNLFLSTDNLVVLGGAQVSASTFSRGTGGSLTVNANNILLSGISTDGLELPSGLFAASGIPGVPFRASGPGGNLTVNAGNLVVANGAQIAVSGLQTGDAGNLRVNAGTVLLQSKGSITAATNSGEGGNIAIQTTRGMVLRDNSVISATAGGTGNGGNITIASPFIIGVSLENSDIIASAFKGRGGSIQISTQGIYGLQFRPRLTPLSDISASSEFGINGVVEIASPQVDPSRGVTPLPISFTDTRAVVATACRASSGNQNEFVVTGRGGLPSNPTETLSTETVLADLGNLETHAAQSTPAVQPPTGIHPSPAAAQTPDPPLVEAQGWVKDATGQVYLTSRLPSPAPVWLPPPDCKTAQNQP